MRNIKLLLLATFCLVSDDALFADPCQANQPTDNEQLEIIQGYIDYINCASDENCRHELESGVPSGPYAFGADGSGDVESMEPPEVCQPDHSFHLPTFGMGTTTDTETDINVAQNYSYRNFNQRQSVTRTTNLSHSVGGLAQIPGPGGPNFSKYTVVKANLKYYRGNRINEALKGEKKINLLTPVRSQTNRPWCLIFASVAALESLGRRMGFLNYRGGDDLEAIRKKNYNLSEQMLVYRLYENMAGGVKRTERRKHGNHKIVMTKIDKSLVYEDDWPFEAFVQDLREKDLEPPKPLREGKRAISFMKKDGLGVRQGKLYNDLVNDIDSGYPAVLRIWTTQQFKDGAQNTTAFHQSAEHRRGLVLPPLDKEGRPKAYTRTFSAIANKSDPGRHAVLLRGIVHIDPSVDAMSKKIATALGGGYFLVKNSWGNNGREDGYGTVVLPFNHLAPPTGSTSPDQGKIVVESGKKVPMNYTTWTFRRSVRSSKTKFSLEKVKFEE